MIRQVQTKALKGKEFIGVAAGKFHTLLYTKNEVYSWGLNAGQLGTQYVLSIAFY